MFIIIVRMNPVDVTQRFGFLVNEVGRLYGRRFDLLSRQQLGLSRAQCRLIAALAMHEGERPMSQADLAQRLDLTAMGVATLCDRMEAAGWIRRQPSATDRRANEVGLRPSARKAFEAAVALGDAVQAQALAGLTAAERQQLVALLRRAQANLQALGEEASAP
jgi:DNA-binding MarR family transcriptional regulator